MLHSKFTRLFLAIMLFAFLVSCNSRRPTIKKEEIVADPKSMDSYVAENLRSMIDLSIEGNGKSPDSVRLAFINIVDKYFRENNDVPAWSTSQSWKPISDSFLNFINQSAAYGLFPEDYHFSRITSLRKELNDSLAGKDAVKWARAELYYTDAFFHLFQDLKQGRIIPDSLTMRSKEEFHNSFFIARFKEFQTSSRLQVIVDSVQPRHTGYHSLKSSLPSFLDSMDKKAYTYLAYPYKDSAAFSRQLFRRLGESGMADENTRPDTVALKAAITKYQAKKKIKQDGKISAALIKLLNNTDREKFKRIAITLDRYKLLPEKMPAKYIWVNIPGFYLKLVDADTTVFESKVVVGKPGTPTPLITSAITDLVIYPTWTVPSSIIVKEMLPALKKNPRYLEKKGLNLLDSKGQVIDASAINWAKYSKGIPYRIQQGSGDDNALGVIKFNFSNPYSVYLHDTNQRYLFKNSMRSLSHGCVRVQEWEKLAFYIVRNDSMLSKQPDSLKYNTDSITTWIAMKEKHRIDVKNKFPLFIRYFGCEAVNGKLKFYDDIYGLDKLMRERYFQGK